MTKETWENIPGYEGYYKLSNLKRVKRVARYGVSEKIVSQRNKDHGKIVVLTKDGKSSERKVDYLMLPVKHKERVRVYLQKPKTIDDLMNQYTL